MPVLPPSAAGTGSRVRAVSLPRQELEASPHDKPAQEIVTAAAPLGAIRWSVVVHSLFHPSLECGFPGLSHRAVACTASSPVPSFSFPGAKGQSNPVPPPNGHAAHCAAAPQAMKTCELSWQTEFPDNRRVRPVTCWSPDGRRDTEVQRTIARTEDVPLWPWFPEAASSEWIATANGDLGAEGSDRYPQQSNPSGCPAHADAQARDLHLPLIAAATPASARCLSWCNRRPEPEQTRSLQTARNQIRRIPIRGDRHSTNGRLHRSSAPRSVPIRSAISSSPLPPSAGCAASKRVSRQTFVNGLAKALKQTNRTFGIYDEIRVAPVPHPSGLRAIQTTSPWIPAPPVHATKFHAG